MLMNGFYRQLLFLSTNDITKEEKNGLLGYFPLSYIILQFISRTPPQKVKSPLQVSFLEQAPIYPYVCQCYNMYVCVDS